MKETSPTESRPSWTRYFLPSIADLLFIVLLFALSAGAISERLLRDAGIGWHIRTGEQILLTHTVPRVDIFSSTMEGKPWFAWEWLYDVFIASVHHVAGLNGVVFFSAFVIALTFALTFRLTLARGAGLATAFVFILLALSAATIHFLARPHVLGWLLTVIWIFLLDSLDTHFENKRRLLWLPAIMLLWVNIHGGYVTGFILLGIYFLGNVFCYLTAKDAERRSATGNKLKLLALATAICALVSLANPYGYRLHVHVYQYLSNRFLMDHIDEFVSPNFHGIAQQCFAALVVLSLLALALGRKKPRPVELLLIVFAVASGFYASRSLPVSSLLIVMMVAPLWQKETSDAPEGLRVAGFLRSFSRRMGTMERQLTGHLLAIVAVGLGLWMCAHDGKLGSQRLMNAQFDAGRFPVKAVDQMMREPIGGPLFGLDYWGGYLIYRLYPTQVVLDDRHDLYGEQFLRDYLKVIKIEPGWDKILDSYNAEWVLLPPESPLANRLLESQQWLVMYQNKTSILFRKFRYQKNR